MGGPHASGSARTAALAVAAVVALAAAGLAGSGVLHAVLLAAAGGFALGFATASRPRLEAPAEVGAAREPPGREPPPVPAAAAPGPAALAAERATIAAVAHDMSSPLATLKSNLEWLRDALDHGRLRAPPDEEAEAREVLRDARDAAERLRADVGVLRARGNGNGGRGPGAPR
jgi:signal transduction histidine kinase